MKRSELTNICNEIIKIHMIDLQSETSEILNAAKQSQENPYEFIGNVIGNLSANSVMHSVQAVADVLVNVGLLELEDD